MKVDPNAPVYPSSINENLGGWWVSNRNYTGIPIRLAIAAQMASAMLYRFGPYEDDATSPGAMPMALESVPNVDQVSEYALAQADALIAAYNGEAK